ncbi:nucleotidyltransferase family protein [Stenomitos frigidus]|uniref:nucleotidyltransferase family protein n=1 Tax=Stenomitos frigidus TaxID=1886765 RepID=UPI001C63496F|nr:nucleotidyltransferase family protein [Stenomitos frigidus]
MKTQNIDIPKETIAHFCQHWHITKLSLFGSVLRDDFRPDSDIDVLVEFQPEYIPGFLKLHRIQEELSTLLGNRPIDLVTPKFLNHRIRDRILSEAEVHYVAER